MMRLRSLLLDLDASPACADRTRLAIQLAMQHDCHLVAVAATGVAHPFDTPHLAPPRPDLVGLAWDKLRDEAEANVQHFRDACACARFRAFEVVIDERDRAASVIERAHCSDLVILPKEGPATHAGHVGWVDEVVLASARPTLIVPPGHCEAISKALVAWDDSREAARAVSDALPLLSRCEEVQVVTWEEDARSSARTMRDRLDALQRWLAWHGVSADVRMEVATVPVADALLSCAASVQGGLIVMGAYGHLRLSERLLGGATRDLLRLTTVPVLMSH